MRCAYWLIVTAAVGLLAAGCRSHPFFGGDVIPAHTERFFAPMSLPAFAADGSMYVANGDTLLHFAADGTRLQSSALPVDLADFRQGSFTWPHGYSTPAGEVFVALDLERIGLLGETQQFTWIKDCRNTQSAPVPMAHGLLIERLEERALGVTFFDQSGSGRWRVPGVTLSPYEVQVDEQGRAYFCANKSLSIMSESGAELLQVSISPASQYLRLLHVRADRMLLDIDGSVSCYNLKGEELWRLAPPDDRNYYYAGLVLAADRYVVQLKDESGAVATERLLIVDQQGHIAKQLQLSQYWRILGTPGTEFIAYLVDHTDSGLNMFTSEGELLWTHSIPQAVGSEQLPAGKELYAEYPPGTAPVVGADGKIYYTVDNTLYAVDREGRPLWQATGTAYHDEWQDDFYFVAAPP